MDAPETHAPEEVLWSGKSSQWQFLGQWIAGLMVAALFAAAIYYFRDDLARQSRWAMPWAYALPLLVALLTFGFVGLQRRKRRYSITNRRVIVETGLVVRDSNEIRIQDIRSINVTKSAVVGLLGIGNVEFSSAATDDADVVFFGVAGADKVRDLVRKLQS